MTRFIIIRVIQAFFALIGIITLVFFLVRLSGNPAELLKNPNMTPQAYEALMERLGLNKSNWEQYKIYITDLAHGDLGQSLLKFRPVSEMIGNALPNTLKLAVPSFVIGLLLAVFLGVLAATRRDSFLDNGVKFLAILGQALPGFWVVIMAVLDSEYIKTARIKGLPERVIIWKPALRNALISPLTAAGMILAGMIGGADRKSTRLNSR